jgi:hypothetical protein
MDTDFLLEVAQGDAPQMRCLARHSMTSDMEEPFLVHSNGRHTYVYPHDGISYSPCETINKKFDKFQIWIYTFADRFKTLLQSINVVPTLNVLQLLNFFTFLGFFIYYVIAPKND